MKTIYRLIRRLDGVIAEGGVNRPWLRADGARRTALAAAMIIAFGNVQALPAGAVVAAGNVSMRSDGAGLTITQTTPNAVLNWQSFNIAAGESVRFVQPGKDSVVLNRVLGSDPSSVLGSLTANGKVFLVNPNGVLFGQGAQVNVAGLVASTLNISDHDFLAGSYQFSGAGIGTISNQGTIRADGGYVALLGGNVSNDGVIAARLGTVALAAGNAITLDVAGDGLLNVTLNQGALNAVVRNGGMVQANGGQVLLTSHALDRLLPGVVNNTGLIQAQTIEEHHGTIRLQGDKVNVGAGSTLDASGFGNGQTGGTVQVLGQTVQLTGATIDVSGDAGGGLVQVGGNFGGVGPEQNALTTGLDGNVSIRADAINRGDGGRIAIWSDGDTTTGATLTARGGAQSGDGGFIETSGKHLQVADSTRVDTQAAHGKSGTWLLDPTDFTIAASGGDMSGTTLSAALVTSNVSILSTNGINGTDGDIHVEAAISWTASSNPTTLTLTALRDVNLNQAVTATNGNLVVVAAQDVHVNAALTSTNGAIALNAGRDANLLAAITTTDGSLRVNAARDININAALTTTRGDLLLLSDSDGSGPGIGGGTVAFTANSPVATVTNGNARIFYNPQSYAAPHDYTANFTSGSGLNAAMWAFVQANDKVYDGVNTATLFFAGDPAASGAHAVSLSSGSGTFDSSNVGTNKTVTYNGFGLTGADGYKFALFSGSGKTLADVTQATLILTALDASKTYGDTPVLTAFSQAGLVNGETIGGVTETSPGTQANAAAKSYSITPSNATGGTFTASNYAITYVNGTLTVNTAVTSPTVNSSDHDSGSAEDNRLGMEFDEDTTAAEDNFSTGTSDGEPTSTENNFFTVTSDGESTSTDNNSSTVTSDGESTSTESNVSTVTSDGDPASTDDPSVAMTSDGEPVSTDNKRLVIRPNRIPARVRKYRLAMPKTELAALSESPPMVAKRPAKARTKPLVVQPVAPVPARTKAYRAPYFPPKQDRN